MAGPLDPYLVSPQSGSYQGSSQSYVRSSAEQPENTEHWDLFANDSVCLQQSLPGRRVVTYPHLALGFHAVSWSGKMFTCVMH